MRAARRQRRLLAAVRDAAREDPPGTGLAASVTAAQRAGVPAVTIARASMTSPRALAITELTLFGQCSYPGAMHCGCGWADCSACAGYTWACLACGAAYFGTPPEPGLCPQCQPTREDQP